MAIRYPNGKKYIPAQNTQSHATKPAQKKLDYSNRGMTLEEDLNETNQYYIDNKNPRLYKS